MKFQMNKGRNKVLYTGVELVVNGRPVHCTLHYTGSICDMEKILDELNALPLGKAVTLHFVRYGESRTHEVYQVELPDEIADFFQGHIPHVTMWTANGESPADSWETLIKCGQSCPCDFTVSGVVGYWTPSGFHTKKWVE